MSALQISVWTAVAVLLFWTLGAYNRLVGLRDVIGKRFGAVDARLCEQHVQLGEQVEVVGAVLANAGERLEALQAAQRQTEAARLDARAHPGAPDSIRRLRLACELLAETRARLPLPAAPGDAVSELNARITETEAALGFARRQFNEAVLEYNHAIDQIPTRLIAALFNFEPAEVW